MPSSRKSAWGGDDTWGTGNTRTVACVSSHQNCPKCVVGRWYHSPAADSASARQKPIHLEGGSGEEMPVTKVWISDIPISCDGKDIETALVRLGCVLRSSLINEKIRNKDGKLTRFLTGRRFVFVTGENSKDRVVHLAPAP